MTLILPADASIAGGAPFARRRDLECKVQECDAQHVKFYNLGSQSCIALPLDFLTKNANATLYGGGCGPCGIVYKSSAFGCNGTQNHHPVADPNRLGIVFCLRPATKHEPAGRPSKFSRVVCN